MFPTPATTVWSSRIALGARRCRGPRRGSSRGRGRTAPGRVARSSRSRSTACAVGEVSDRPEPPRVAEPELGRRCRGRRRGAGDRLRSSVGRDTVNCPVMPRWTPEQHDRQPDRPEGIEIDESTSRGGARPATFAPVTVRVPAWLPRPAEFLLALPHAGDRPPGEQRPQVADDGFDFGQFRHEISPRRSRERESRPRTHYREPPTPARTAGRPLESLSAAFPHLPR